MSGTELREFRHGEYEESEDGDGVKAATGTEPRQFRHGEYEEGEDGDGVEAAVPILAFSLHYGSNGDRAKRNR